MRLAAVCSLVPGLMPEELADWIARGWVQPGGDPPDWVFAELDVARVRLVHDLRVDAGVDEESLALVLSLLDQVYGLRRALRAVLQGLQEQPEPIRQAVLGRLKP